MKIFFCVDKLYMHLEGFEPTISPSVLSEEKVPLMPKLIGTQPYERCSLTSSMSNFQYIKCDRIMIQ